MHTLIRKAARQSLRQTSNYLSHLAPWFHAQYPSLVAGTNERLSLTRIWGDQ